MEETISPAVVRLTRRRQQITSIIQQLQTILEAIEIDLRAEELQAQADSYGGVPTQASIDRQEQ